MALHRTLERIRQPDALVLGGPNRRQTNRNRAESGSLAPTGEPDFGDVRVVGCVLGVSEVERRLSRGPDQA